MTELEQYIQAYFGLKNDDLALLSTLFQQTHLEKQAFFTQKNYYCTKLSFIKSGYLRVFDTTSEKEVTQWIASKGEFVTDLSSIIFQRPARWTIQALTDCELYTISDDNYRSIQKLVPQWNHLEKLFIAKCFLALEDRVYSFLSMSAEERYQHLFNEKAALFNEVPLHFLASMLGITPETLSRIRKKTSS